MAKVGIYCGHGRSTDGSWDPGTTYSGNNESALMLPITKAVAKYLKASGVAVDTDADDRNNINMIKQVERANAKKVDLFVSIHCDWYKAGTGTMPLYVSTAGKKLATAINKAVMADMKMKTRGVIKRTDLYELTDTDMPACIFETGSIKADLATLKKADAYGKAIAKGICAYLGVKFKEPATSGVKALFEVKLKASMNMRTGPGTDYKRIGGIKKDTIVTIFDTNKGKTWGYTKEGWVCVTSKYVAKA